MEISSLRAAPGGHKVRRTLENGVRSRWETTDQRSCSQLMRASPEEVTRVGGPSPFPVHTPPPALAVKARSKAPAGSQPLRLREKGAVHRRDGSRDDARRKMDCPGSDRVRGERVVWSLSRMSLARRQEPRRAGGPEHENTLGLHQPSSVLRAGGRAGGDPGREAAALRSAGGGSGCPRWGPQLPQHPWRPPGSSSPGQPTHL